MRVLLLHAGVVNRTATEALLTAVGVEVVATDDADKALEVLSRRLEAREKPIVAALVSREPRGMTGVKFAREADRLSRHLPRRAIKTCLLSTVSVGHDAIPYVTDIFADPPTPEDIEAFLTHIRR